MTPPEKLLRIGCKTAIDAAMTSNSKTCPVRTNPAPKQALPYIRVGSASATSSRDNKTHQGTTMIMSFNVHADDPAEVDDLLNIAVAALTDRSSAISVDSSVNLITYFLDDNGISGMFENEMPTGIQYMKQFRIKYRTHE